MSSPIDYQQLRHYEIFKELSDHALIELAKICQSLDLHAGETLFDQNDSSETLYLLETGQIHVIRQYPDGEEVILATEGPYYVIGDLSMLVGQPRVGAVVAVSDCTLFAIHHEPFYQICDRVPDIATKVIIYLAQRLRYLNLKVREYAISNVAARIASILWLLSEGEAGVIKSRIRVSRLARAIATDADTIERILRQWDKKGYITYDDQHLQIHDIEKIRDIAG